MADAGRRAVVFEKEGSDGVKGVVSPKVCLEVEKEGNRSPGIRMTEYASADEWNVTHPKIHVDPNYVRIGCTSITREAFEFIMAEVRRLGRNP